jgi:hypothetical protein
MVTNTPGQASRSFPQVKIKRLASQVKGSIPFLVYFLSTKKPFPDWEYAPSIGHRAQEFNLLTAFSLYSVKPMHVEPIWPAFPSEPVTLASGALRRSLHE